MVSKPIYRKGNAVALLHSHRPKKQADRSPEEAQGEPPAPSAELSAKTGTGSRPPVSEHNADTNGDISPPKDEEVDVRMSEIKDMLGHAAMHVLEKCALVAEWVRHAEAKLSVFGQIVPKPKGGRPEGGISRAARELPIPGKTPDARRKFIERALKIDGIWPEAKSTAGDAGLDDIQSVLLSIAVERTRGAQIEKVKKIAARKAAPRQPAPHLGQIDDGSPEMHEIALSSEDAVQLAELAKTWSESGVLKREEWKQASEPVRRRLFNLLLNDAAS